MNRPSFFISSTVHDFRDLRSALKFYLEQNGCRVLASEYNDFDKSLALHSYDACLEAISSADYFILLIGNRVGGWFDQSARISITQQEYREAYRLQSAGKLKLLNFVRSEVWQVREDRHELTKYLATLDLSNEVKHRVANYPSKFAENAEFISDFIAEIGKNTETKLSVQNGGIRPIGNWIHIFNTFRDIVDVLDGQIFSSTPADVMCAKRLLRRELRDFVKHSLVKNKDGVFSPRLAIEKFHAAHPITLETKRQDFTTVERVPWNAIRSLSLTILGCQFHPVVLPHILSQATFLEFDMASASYKETPVYEALLCLQDEIRQFARSNNEKTLGVIFEHFQRAYPAENTSIKIETIKLASLLFLLDRWSNILDLSSALIRYLDGLPFKLPKLRPFSPVQGMQAELECEIPSTAEVDAYVARFL